MGRLDRWEHFAPDFRWRMIGSTPASGTAIGEAGLNEQVGEFRRRLASLKVTIDSLICEGDTVVKLAHSDGLTIDGKVYRNEYSTVFRFAGGKIVDVVEYLDTALIETVIFGKVIIEGGDAGVSSPDSPH